MASDVLGLEISGTVASVGAGVSDWTVGDNVCALVSGGGYAQYCTVQAPQCLPVQEVVDLVDAAALPEACFTVWTNLFERGRLVRGEAVLLHGGSYATAGSRTKCAACEQLGAGLAVNYRTDDFVAAVKQVTDGRGVDLILDMVGGSYLRRNLESLAVEGRLVLIGLMEGATAEIDLAALMSRRLVVTGSTLRSRSVAQKAAIAAAVRDHVWSHTSPRSVLLRSFTRASRWPTRQQRMRSSRPAPISGNWCW